MLLSMGSDGRAERAAEVSGVLLSRGLVNIVSY